MLSPNVALGEGGRPREGVHANDFRASTGMDHFLTESLGVGGRPGRFVVDYDCRRMGYIYLFPAVLCLQRGRVVIFAGALVDVAGDAFLGLSLLILLGL